MNADGLYPVGATTLLQHYKSPPEAISDPRKAQLLALFDLSDKRGQDLLIAIAGIHADRYPKVPK